MAHPDWDAALCFTAQRGWYLQPSPELEQLVVGAVRVKKQKRGASKANWKMDVEETRRVNLKAGYSMVQVDALLKKIAKSTE